MLRKQIFVLFFLLTSPEFLFSGKPKPQKKERFNKVKQPLPLKGIRKRPRDESRNNNSTSSIPYKKRFTQKRNTYQTTDHRFIYDKYTDRRGTPKMLNIYCDECDEYLMSYQKDGPGRLLRCYLDRIRYPRELNELQYKYFNPHSSQDLVCKKCFLIIGNPMIYRLENRPAYRMINNRSYFKIDYQ